MISTNESIRRKLLACQALARKVAHDSNNYYGIIQGYLSLLEIKAAEEEQLREHLAPMQEAVELGVRLNKRLAGFYRIGEPIVTTVQLGELVPEICQAFTEEQDWNIQVAVKPGMETVKLDPDALRELIRNLCLLLKTTATEPAVITLDTCELEQDEIEDLVFESQPGKYAHIETHLELGHFPQEEETGFLNPFAITSDPDRDLGAASILTTLQIHGGNLDVRIENNRAHLDLYFPL